MIDLLNQPGVVALLALATAVANLAFGRGLKKPIQDLKDNAFQYTDLVNTLTNHFETLIEEHGAQISRVLDIVTVASENYGGMVDRSVVALDTANDRLAALTGQVIDHLRR